MLDRMTKPLESILNQVAATGENILYGLRIEVERNDIGPLRENERGLLSMRCLRIGVDHARQMTGPCPPIIQIVIRLAHFPEERRWGEHEGDVIPARTIAARDPNQTAWEAHAEMRRATPRENAGARRPRSNRRRFST